MTVTLRVENAGGPYTVEVRRCAQSGHSAPEVLGTIKPGEAQTVTLWDTNYIQILEVPLEKPNG